jgi:hypothetical protein
MNLCRLFCIVLFAPLFVRGANEALVHAPKRMDQLKAVIDSADRLEIRTTAGTTDDKGKPIDPGPYTVIQRERIAAEFLECCVISEEELQPPCLCGGVLYVEFYRGSTKLARLYYHKEGTVDWYDGPWKGFAPIESGAKEKLRKWFRQHGAAQELAGVGG